MADLRIVDAPLLSTVKGTEKLPTGGEGNFSVSVNQVADFAKLKWVLATEGYVDTAVNGVRSELVTHVNAINNPHQVTKTQVGLGNVDNTADVDKPIGSATQAALTTLSQNKAEKTYVDTQLNNKADKTATYTKTETDSLVSAKSDTTYVNTKYSSHIKTFLNTGTALSNTVNGEYFFVISSDSEKVEDLYLNVNGVATNQNKSELSSLLQHNSILGRDVTGAHQATSIGTASGANQQEINDFGGAKWYNKSGGYALGATVKLENGDIVKSTIPNNITNPNIGMTGWVSPSAEVSGEISKIYSEKLIYITPEQFGAKGDGIADDTQAIKDCIDYILTTPEQSRRYAIRGYGDYLISDSLLIVNFGFGVDIYLRSIRAHASFPAPTAFNKGTPLFQVGKDAIGGSMVGLNIECTYVNGGGKATWIDVSGMGCGGSYFHADKLENVVNGVSGIKPNFHAASNKITGGYWVNGTGHGVAIEKGDFVVEGWVIDVNFIAEFNAGGVLLRDAQYTNIRGQTDFNGRWLSELTLSASMLNRRDKTFSNNGKTGVVIASYEHPKGVHKALVYEGQNASSLGSKFANGAATCDGWSGSVTAIKTADTDSFFFDVIHDFSGQPFAKCILEMPYCGGIVGGMQYTSQISAKRSTESFGGANNGFAVAHDGTSIIMRDEYNNSQLLTASPTYIAPDRHLYMREFRIYGAEVGATLMQGAATDVYTFVKKNDGTVPSVCEMYKVTFSSTDLGLHGEWNVFVSASSIFVKPIYEQNVNASSDGTKFRLVQGATAGVFGIANIQRIF